MNIKKLLLPALMTVATLAAKADADFITHRYDSFKACTLSNESVVFIGNSITNMGNWHEQFGDDQRIVNRGNSGACSYEAVENLESILPYHPAKIFVMIGTNDIGSATGTPESVADYGRTLIERCKNESPETKVHIVSTFPSTNGLRNLENHAEINRRLKEVCEETGTTFIDLWDQMQGIVDNSISIDRLHITAQGYYIWTNALLPYLGEGFTSTMPSGSEARNSYVWSNGNGLRVNMIASMPIKSTDILMIGGEMFNNGEWHELLHNPNIKNRAATYGYGDYTVSYWNTFIGYIFDLNKSIKTTPAQIYLNIGSQDINANADINTLKSQYRTAVNTLVSKAAGSKIHLVALTPHKDAAKNAKTQEFNAYMQELAAELDLTYVDIFTPCAQTDGTPNPAYITTTLNAPYASARGYLQIARTLAPYIGDCTVDSDEDFAARYELINVRQALGNLITQTYTLQTGTTTGTYSAECIENFDRDGAYALLANGADAATIRTFTEQNPFVPTLNQPTDGKYYTIRSQRADRVLMANGTTGVMSAIRADADLTATTTQWQLRQRADGTWDIICRDNGNYLNYATSGFSLASTAPAAGYTISGHDTQGAYIIVSGTNQLHQANSGNSWNILNWGGGNKTNDEGCAFFLDELPEPQADGPEIANAIVTRVTDVNELKDGDKILIRIHNTLTDPNLYLAVNASGEALATNWDDIADVNSAIYVVEESATTFNATTFPSPYNNALYGSKYYKFKHNEQYLALHNSLTLADSYGNAARLAKVTSLPECTGVAGHTFDAETDNKGFFLFNIEQNRVAYCDNLNGKYGFQGGYTGANGTAIYYNGLKNGATNNITPTVFAQRRLTPFFRIYKVVFITKESYQDDYDAACNYYSEAISNHPVGNYPGAYAQSSIDAVTAAKNELTAYWESDDFSPEGLNARIQALHAAVGAVSIFDIHSIEGPALVRISISDAYASMPDNSHVNMHGNKYYLSNENAPGGAGVTTDSTAEETVYILRNNDARNRCELVNYSTGHALKSDGSLGTSAADNTPGDVNFVDRTPYEVGAYGIHMYIGTQRNLCTIWARAEADIPYFCLFSTGNPNDAAFNNWNVAYVDQLTVGQPGVKTIWRAPVTLQVAEGSAYTLYSDIAAEKILSERAGNQDYPEGTAFVLDGVVTFNVKNGTVAEAHSLGANTLGSHAKHTLAMQPGVSYLSTLPLIAANQEVMLSALAQDDEATQDVVNFNVYTVNEETPVELPAHAVVLMAAPMDNATIDVKLDAETPTSISEIFTSDKDTEAIYDLMGRRLTTPVKGAVNIVNGKKIKF